jgi:hypothetical protein
MVVDGRVPPGSPLLPLSSVGSVEVVVVVPSWGVVVVVDVVSSVVVVDRGSSVDVGGAAEVVVAAVLPPPPLAPVPSAPPGEVVVVTPELLGGDPALSITVGCDRTIVTVGTPVGDPVWLLALCWAAP